VTILTQEIDRTELGVVHFGWFMENRGFHFVGKLGVSNSKGNLGFPL
jgi:hypothetical protein